MDSIHDHWRQHRRRPFGVGHFRVGHIRVGHFRVGPIAWAFAATLLGNLSSAAAPAGAEESAVAAADVVYGHKDGLALTMDVFGPRAESNRAGILFVVSGGWVSRWMPPESMEPWFRHYLDRGYTVFAVRHGSSPRYGIRDAFDDVGKAARFLRREASRWDVDPKRLGATGMSAGGHLALMLGTESAEESETAEPRGAASGSLVDAVVALVPPTDLTVVVWEAPESLPAYRNFPALDLGLGPARDLSPLHRVSGSTAPCLVIMGERDELVPATHGQWIAERFREKKVPHRLVVLSGAGHGLEGADHQKRWRRESVDWFDEHLTEANRQ